MYTNQDSVHKAFCRMYLLKKLVELGVKSPTVLSLPATNFQFEKLISDNFKSSHIICVEKNHEVVKEALLNDNLGLINKKEGTNLEYFQDDILDYLNETEVTFDLIWLDLCTNITPQLVAKLISLFQTVKVNKTLIFSVTFMSNREHYIDNLKHYYNVTTNEEVRTKMIPKLILEKVNRNISLLSTEVYKSELKKTPNNMTMFTFKISE